MRMTRRILVPVAAVFAVGFGSGAAARNAAEPFVVDGPFWRDFLTGPPAAGLFAIVAACIAFFPALRTAQIARSNSAREQWWLRAQWALGLATSNRVEEREISKDALVALSAEATELEMGMIVRLIADLQPRSPVDTHGDGEDNRGRRWSPWARRAR
jgi:hypothetical protein